MIFASVVSAQPDYSVAHWKPPSCTKWYSSGNGHHFVVIHDMEGYYQSGISYLNRCDTDANGNFNVATSVYYLVNSLKNGSDEDGHAENNSGDVAAGDITQQVREFNYAWHARCWNTWMFGTEHEGFASSPAWYSEEMYVASAGLQRHLCDAYGIPKDRNHIIGHNEKQTASWLTWMAANYPSIDASCNDHTDPGQYWDWTHFMNLVLGGTGTYWDVNGATTGAGGATPSGTWSATSTNWSSAASGNVATGPWAGDIAIFSAGSDATGSYTVTVSGTQTINALWVEDGNPTFTSGELDFTGSGTYYSNYVAAGHTATFNTPFGGTGSPDKWGPGTVVYKGASTSAGYFSHNEGTMLFGNNTALSSGRLELGDTTGNLVVTIGTSDATARTLTSKFVLNAKNFNVAAGGDLTVSGFIDSGTAASTIAVSNSITTFSGAITNTGGIAKSGPGTLTFSGASANTYGNASANTTVSEGTFRLAKASGVNAVANGTIVVNGGTFLLGSANQIADAVAMTFAGGTFNSGGLNETLGTAKLTGNSSIDLGASASVVHFANSSGVAWTASTTLTINNWNGSTSGAGTDQIYFGSTGGGLAAGQVAQVSFLNPAGFPSGTYAAQILGTGEVVPVGLPPTVTTQPISQTVSPGANVSFSVAVSGSTPLSYQWRFNNADISSASGSSYDLNNVLFSDSGDYRVVVVNAFGSATSVVATLTVSVSNSQPSIITQPAAQTVNQGSNATFAVLVTGTAPFTYQWRFNGAAISNASNSSYTRGNVQAAHAGSYSVAITNEFGFAISTNAVLAVNLPPSITTQPLSQSVSAAANVTFTVAATGTAPLGYQWRKNGVIIASATTSSYTKNNVQSADVGLYSVVVSNFLGTATSADASLTLNAVIVFSDDFESGNLNNWFLPTAGNSLAISMVQNHTSGGADAALLSASTNKMVHNLGAELEGRAKLTFYAYDATAGNVNSGQTRWFGELRGYTGAGYNNGSLSQLFAIGRYGVGFGTGTGTLATEVVNTTNYQGRVVTGANAGWFNLTVARTAGWHKFEIERATDGTTITFSVDGVVGRTITSATFYTFDSVTMGSVATSSTTADMWFDDFKVEYFDAPTITTQPTSRTVNAGANTTFSVIATNNEQSYQWRLNGANISSATTTAFTVNNAQAADAGSYTVVVGNGAGVTVSSVATLGVAPVIMTNPLNRTNSAGTIATFTVVANGQEALTYQWRHAGTNLADGGNISGAATATLAVNNVAQVDTGSYTVVVTNAAGNATSSAAMLVLVDPPVVNASPSNLAVAAGANATFTVNASSSVPLSYQWNFGGADIPGATGSSYTRTNCQSADAGNYAVTVGNSAGSVPSSAAELTVNHPPVLAAIGNRTIHAGATLVVTNVATDADAGQAMTFTLELGTPVGAVIDSASGVFTWTAAGGDAGSTNIVTTRVTDGGTPVLGDTNSFSIIVVSKPLIGSITVSGGTITMGWDSIAGQKYRVQYKLNLEDPDWITAANVTASGTATAFSESMETDLGLVARKFYRLVAVQ